MLFCVFQPISDVTKWDCCFNDATVLNNEVRACSSNPYGLFLMALNALFSLVFLKCQTSSMSQWKV